MTNVSYANAAIVAFVFSLLLVTLAPSAVPYVAALLAVFLVVAIGVHGWRLRR